MRRAHRYAAPAWFSIIGHAFPSRLRWSLIVGGGPGGLTAAIYLRRVNRKVALFDKGKSRLSLIPVSHNCPSFPEGVPGQQLLDNLRAQLERYGGQVTDGEILRLRIEDGDFVGEYDGGEVRALTVLLAIGLGGRSSNTDSQYLAVDTAGRGIGLSNGTECSRACRANCQGRFEFGFACFHTAQWI